MPIKNNNGSIRLYFTFNGVNYTLSKLGKFDDPTSLATAKNILKAIESDISIGKFSAKDSVELFTAYHPLSSLIDSQKKQAATQDCLDIVTKVLGSKKLLDRNLVNTRNFLQRYGTPIKSETQARLFWQWLQCESNGNNRTINRHLEILKPICPYFENIPKLKAEQIIPEKPFALDEITKIITTLENDFSHYADFVKFLFATGCRPNEATAVRWSDIDFHRNTISIAEAIGVDVDGKKVAKRTKADKVRTFPMSPTMKAVLTNRELNHIVDSLDSLIFTSPKGAIIDIRNFRAKVWAKALKLAKVPYRKPYNIRHTFISHYIEKYKDYQKCAAITHGSKSGVETIIKHYSHLVSDIETLDLF